MAYKEFHLTGELPVKIYKRKSSRSLRLSVSPKGEVRVSIPSWVPYQSGFTFAASRLEWIESQLPSSPSLLQDGQAVGKAHRLKFVAARNSAQPTGRISGTEIIVSYGINHTIDDASVQKAAERACIRALRSEAERLLPQRLRSLAEQKGYGYRSVRIKQLKSRWGSCDQQQNITLNLFLVQLPWKLIDYVLLHELAHTKVMQHGPKFWAEMEQLCRSAKQDRQAMRTYQPILYANSRAAVA